MEFIDQAVRKAVLDALDAEEIGDAEELREIERLSVTGVHTLIDLTHLPSLHDLSVCDSQLEGNDPFAGLEHLTRLQLEKVSGFSSAGLRNLTQLKVLRIEYCGLQEVSGLSGMERLHELHLCEHGKMDISALRTLRRLQELWLWPTQVEDVSPLLALEHLRYLSMDTKYIKDRSVLGQQPFLRTLDFEETDVPEAKPDAWKPRKKSMPRIERYGHVHPRVHFCRNAELVRLKGGMERLVSRRYRKGMPECFELYLDDKQLIQGYVPGCATCSGHLWAGYGDGLMNIEECMAVRDRINDDYHGLKAALDNITPLLGLLASGVYAIADAELFPFMYEGTRDGKVDGEYFWDAPGYRQESQFSHTSGSYDEAHVPPLYLFPTQRAANMNPERVEAYMRRLEGGEECFPRAVALYLSGSIALLLDGHHKAAACAALGKRVPTLVIFPVEETEELKAALHEGRRLYMTQRGKYWNAPIDIRDGKDRYLADTVCIQRMKKKRIYVPMQKEEEIPWGRVDDKYRTECFGAYPRSETLFQATELAPDVIQQTISELITTPPSVGDPWSRERNYRDLCAYDRLFPDSDVFTPSQKQYLRDDD